MIHPVSFKKHLIAPCGMNCGTCIAFLRDKNKCPGCRIKTPDKAVSVKQCIVPKCSYLQKTSSKFCYDCEKYPCQRIKNLDKRYRTKYRTSFIENLTIIKERGLESFLVFESERRTCNHCGFVLSVHRDHCIKCNQTIKN
ncbi:MAG TPA: hypothetical protein DCZ51_04440 [Bacteroidales bacterium]|nr:hypothetical protein [Bacteroidales bacterium]